MTRRPNLAPSSSAGDPAVVELGRVLGHELGELAALFDGYTELLGPGADMTAVGGLQRATARLRDICGDLLELSDVAMSRPARRTVQPAASLAAAQRRLRESATTASPPLTVEVRDVPPVVVDPDDLEQLFTHLLRSLSRSGAPSRNVIVSGCHEGSSVRVDIGPDPTRRAGSATPCAGSLVGRGLVFALSSRIAERNHGSLRLAANGSFETTISLTLPAGAS
jgi:hypothetical protein